MNTTKSTKDIYIAPRGDKFKEFIRTLLNKADLKTKYTDILLSDKSLTQYSIAFTSSSADSVNNFEVYEQLGDVTANKFLVWYMYTRFPKLKCSDGVKIVARLRINYGAKQSFFERANLLGFWPFISASVEERATSKKPLLEDTFESFIGVTESLLDEHFDKYGIGNALVYRFLKNVFDEIEISLKYEDLIDCKTRLKELFDYHGSDKLGVLDYIETKDVHNTVVSSVFRITNGTGKNKKRDGRQIFIAKGYGNIKTDAQQNAAMNALEALKKDNIIKPGAEDFFKKFY